MSQYQVDEQNMEHMATYLTHKQTHSEYLLRELTFNEIREFTNIEEKLKRREKVSHPRLTNLVSSMLVTQEWKSALRTRCAQTFTRSTPSGSTPARASWTKSA